MWLNCNFKTKNYLLYINCFLDFIYQRRNRSKSNKKVTTSLSSGVDDWTINLGEDHEKTSVIEIINKGLTNMNNRVIISFVIDIVSSKIVVEWKGNLTM
jgi:hypothetical protein